MSHPATESVRQSTPDPLESLAATLFHPMGSDGVYARTALYEAANVLLARITRFSKLKRWGMDVAKRRGNHRGLAQVAVPLTNDLFQDWPPSTYTPYIPTTDCRPANGARTRLAVEAWGLNGENPEQWRPGVLKLGR